MHDAVESRQLLARICYGLIAYKALVLAVTRPVRGEYAVRVQLYKLKNKRKSTNSNLGT